MPTVVQVIMPYIKNTQFFNILLQILKENHYHIFTNKLIRFTSKNNEITRIYSNI